MTEPDPKPPPPPTPEPIPPTLQQALKELAEHREWTKKELEDVRAKIAALTPAEQKAVVKALEKGGEPPPAPKKEKTFWDRFWGYTDP